MICHAPTLNAKGGSGVAVEDGRMADVAEGAVVVVVVETKDEVENLREKGTLLLHGLRERPRADSNLGRKGDEGHPRLPGRRGEIR